MFRRRKRKNITVNETQSESPQSVQSPNSDTPPRTVASTHQETKTRPLLSDTFRSTVEKAADRLRSELASEGKLKPMAFFVQADGTMKTVSFSLKGEYQKEVLIRRIREKVSAENISTLIMLTVRDDEKTAVLSGASPGMKGSASISYSFDDKTKSVTSWKTTWLNQPVQNVFLDDIFEKKD
jgi:hypothetical protein